MAGRKWTDKDLELLRKHYPTTTTAEMCRMLNRSVRSIYSMAKLLDVRKTEEYLREHVFVMEPAIGEATRFKKGQTPPNKGKKMPQTVYQKVKGTMFKKGNLPHNTKKDGAVSTRTDKNGTKRPWIRLQKGQWVEMKNYVWENENGPIPPGHCIALKDGNPFNYDLKNLECITRQENMERNTIHNYPEDIKQTIIILSKLNKKVRTDGEE